VYTLTRTVEFDSAHQLRDYVGKCANLHGHTYKLAVSVQGEKLDKAGMVYDFVDMKRLLKEVSDELDHHFINEIAPFDEINPTAENVAAYIYQRLAPRLPAGVHLKQIELWETPNCSVTYSES
jgi:6-pyruvoyltetrahydropterin/6-carboxytetrahydropterin synthase